MTMKKAILVIISITVNGALGHALTKPPKIKLTKAQQALCKMGHETVAIQKSRGNNGSKSNGVVFPFRTSLGNAFCNKEKASSGLDFKRAKNVPYYAGDLYVGAQVSDADKCIASEPIPHFFARNVAPPYVPKPDTELGRAEIIDNAQAGMIKYAIVSVDNPKAGVYCPEDGYAPHWFSTVGPNDVICARDKDGETYGLMQIEATCSDGIVFQWKYNKEKGNRMFLPGSPEDSPDQKLTQNNRGS
jgi:hypothetical protein